LLWNVYPGGAKAPLFLWPANTAANSLDQRAARKSPSSLRSHPEASAVINLARIHAYKAGEFSLFDVPRFDVNKMRQYLISSGFVISHIEYV